MNSLTLTLAAFLICLARDVAAETGEDYTKYVNPFIGTEGQGNPGSSSGGGNVFPGASLPFGVVKFGIDTTAFDWTNVDADAGYTPDGYGSFSTPEWNYVNKISDRRQYAA